MENVQKQYKIVLENVIMLRRDVENEIYEWISNDNRALLIDGARQVGKTFIIRECLKKSDYTYVEYNLIEDEGIADTLRDAKDASDLVLKLSLGTDKKIIPNKTIFFLDEIQVYKDILTKIKFLVDDGRYKFILSGSLLGVEMCGLKSAPVGYLKTIKMYPLSFKEFLQLFNVQDEVINILKDSYNNQKEVDPYIHEKMMELFNLYMIIGGMPSAVDVYLKFNNIDDVIDIHKGLVEQYKVDFTKYESEDKKLIISNIYDLIPAELNSSNKRFNIADINKNLRYERISDSFIWLYKAGVALPTFNVTEPKSPLKLNEKSSLMKVFLSDVGILTTLYGKNCKLMILNNDKDINAGSIYENVVAQELTNKGIDLYYYNSKKYGEIDFLYEDEKGVVLVEVKSGKGYQRHSAINNIKEVYKDNVFKSIVFSKENVTFGNDILYLPLYMLMFIEKEKESPIDVDINKYKF